MADVKHVLGISGGKDSAALAIYLKDTYPSLDVEYYTCDTGRELDETYELIDRLESYLGKGIRRIVAIEDEQTSESSPFDHFLANYGGYLPSSTARWCTKALKLEPFEKYMTEQPTISYVGIRGDENRDGYISTKPNVQSIFPFRKNIWSEDVTKEVLSQARLDRLVELYTQHTRESNADAILEAARKPLSLQYPQKRKLDVLLEMDVKLFNRVVFEVLKDTEYPVGQLDEFPLIDNDDVLVRDDIFQTLEDSGVGIPAYYLPIEFEVEIDGEVKTGTYNRSRSGCFFCFFQQKIEWVWLLEQHSELFQKAIQYEKDGYSWMDNETLEELAQPERVDQIKREYYIRSQRQQNQRTSSSWQDDILRAEGEGCAACFI